MKFCPTCQTHYDEEILRFCTKDGTPLVEEESPVFTELPSESEIEDDFDEETIVRRNPPVVPPVLTEDTFVEPAREVSAPRIVIPTTPEEFEQPVRTKVVAYQPPRTKPNTGKIVALTILGTLIVLSGAGIIFMLLSNSNGASQNTNYNTNLNSLDINLNTNLSVDNSYLNNNTNLSTGNLDINVNTGLDTNFNTSFNSNFKTPTPKPSATPTTSPTPEENENTNTDTNTNNSNIAAPTPLSNGNTRTTNTRTAIPTPPPLPNATPRPSPSSPSGNRSLGNSLTNSDL